MHSHPPTHTHLLTMHWEKIPVCIQNQNGVLGFLFQQEWHNCTIEERLKREVGGEATMWSKPLAVHTSQTWVMGRKPPWGSVVLMRLPWLESAHTPCENQKYIRFHKIFLSLSLFHPLTHSPTRTRTCRTSTDTQPDNTRAKQTFTQMAS